MRLSSSWKFGSQTWGRARKERKVLSPVQEGSGNRTTVNAKILAGKKFGDFV